MSEAAAENPPETPVVPRGRFKKGQSGNPGGKLKPKVRPPVPAPPGLVVRDGETQLEAMRWVLSRPTEETYLQWQMRQSLLADREKFLAAKVTLERAASGPSGSAPSGDQTPSGSTSPTGGAGSSAAPDLGTERCLELARGLLEKYGVPR